MRAAAILLLLLSVPQRTSGHGAITIPGPSRNAVDSNTPPWSNGVPLGHMPFEYMCPFPSVNAAAKTHGVRNLSAANGQACFWFSVRALHRSSSVLAGSRYATLTLRWFWPQNGCAIGCKKCDGSTRGVVPKFHQVAGVPCGTSNGTCPPSAGRWVPVPGAKDGNHPGSPQHSCACPGGGKKVCACPVAKTPVCAGNTAKPTVCEPSQRTVNTGAECGSVDDWYQYSPWRHPGSAPVLDVCGSAGGRLPGQGSGGNGASYQKTPHAKEGDLGSKLLQAWSTAMPTTWKPGSIVEVAWA